MRVAFIDWERKERKGREGQWKIDENRKGG
jgi:hypothetical protein